MHASILFALLAGAAWGIGGYFEKSGLQLLNLPPIVGITLRTAVALVVLGLLSVSAWKKTVHTGDIKPWLMILIGGGIVAGSLGMWSFYTALSTTTNLGVTLAVAFALSPLAGTVIGLFRGTQKMDPRIAVGMGAIILGIVLIQLAHNPVK